MNYKRFSICGFIIICCVFIPSLWSNYQNYQKNIPVNYGSEVEEVKYVAKADQIQDVEELKAYAKKYVEYSYTLERIIIGMHDSVRDGWLSWCFVWIGLCAYFSFGYWWGRKRNQ